MLSGIPDAYPPAMPLFSFEGRSPQVHPDAFVAPTATLVGDVDVEAGASNWYGVVLRADFGRIVVRAGANVQDNSVLHGGEERHLWKTTDTFLVTISAIERAMGTGYQGRQPRHAG